MENNSTPPSSTIPHNVNADYVSPETNETNKNTILNLPRVDGWMFPLHLYQGFWSFSNLLEGDILAHQFFKAESSDIFVCSVPKSGTTWLKALTFAIVTRTRYDNFTTPLLNNQPHDCVPFLYLMAKKLDIRVPGVPLISTHVPYTYLPKSALDSDCKVVYICREPKDAFVSLYHFGNLKIMSLEKAFDLFCEGKSIYGPYWDHVLGFWKASQERPKKVLFLKYEEMMKDTAIYVKKLAEFLGYPFFLEEEKQGMVQKIIELCSFENMMNLEVNKSGTWQSNIVPIENKEFFRKGTMGDWKNFLTPEMVQRLDEITEQKLNGSGLTFHIPS
ncbi:hypothetical protein CRYUN_Cryun16bG0091300 [Craigia yunnanensis]